MIMSLFLERIMTTKYMARRYGNSVQEMQVSQRPATLTQESGNFCERLWDILGDEKFHRRRAYARKRAPRKKRNSRRLPKAQGSYHNLYRIFTNGFHAAHTISPQNKRYMNEPNWYRRVICNAVDQLVTIKDNGDCLEARQWANRIESLLALIVGIRSATNWQQVVCMIALYTKTFSNVSISYMAVEELVRIFSEGKASVEARTGREGEHPKVQGDFSAGMSMFKRILSDWKTYRNCPLAGHVTSLINILVTLGLCPGLTEEPVVINGIKLFTARVHDIQEKPLEFVDMVVETLGYFIENAWGAFATGDFTVLVHGNDKLARLDNDYSILMAAKPAIDSGDLTIIQKFCPDITDDQAYEAKIEAVIYEMDHMLKFEQNRSLKTLIQKKILDLRRLQIDVMSIRQTSCIREKPYGILLYGKSSVGKTTLTNLLSKMICSANSIACQKENIFNLNDADKYHSGYKGKHSVVVMDEKCNTKAQHYTEAPTKQILDMLNNVPMASLQAEAELKGRIMLEPKVVIATTNHKTLMSHTFSNEPVSVMRRFEWVLDVSLKPEFVASNGGFDASKARGLMMPDAWNILLQRVRITRTSDDSPDKFDFVSEKIGDREKLSIQEVLKLVRDDSIRFFTEQRALVNRTQNFFSDEVQFCEHCKITEECEFCQCCEIPMPDLELVEIPLSGPEPEPQIFEEAPDREYEDDIVGQYRIDEARREMAEIEQYMPVSHGGDGIRIMSEEEFNDADPYSDEDGIDHFVPIRRPWWIGMWDCFSFTEQPPQHVTIDPDMTTDRGAVFTNPFRNFFQNVNNDMISDGEGCSDNTFASQLQRAVRQHIIRQRVIEAECKAMDHIRTLTDFMKQHRTKLLAVAGLTSIAGILTMCLKGYSVYKTLVPDTQGAPVKAPVPLESDKESVWKKPKFVVPNKTTESSSTTFKALSDKLTDKMGHATFFYDDGATAGCDIIPMRNNLWLAPNHMVQGRSGFRIKVITSAPDQLSLNINQRIDSNFWHRIPDTDYVLILITGGGDQPRFDKFLLEDTSVLPFDIKHEIIYKDSEGGVKKGQAVSRKRQKAEVQSLDKTIISYDAVFYDCSFETFSGLCMAPLISTTRGSYILGFHLAGFESDNLKGKGLCGVLSRKQVDDTAKLFRKELPIVNSSSEFKTNLLGIDVTPKPLAAPSSPVNYMQDDDQGNPPSLEILGTHPLGTRTFKSAVRKSVISDAVNIHAGIPRQHDKPVGMNSYHHWQRDLGVISHPTGAFRTDLWMRAYDDLNDKFQQVLQDKPHLVGLIHKYSRETVINGVNGINSLDPIDKTTSVGFPINQPKKKFMEPSEEPVPNVADPYTLDEKFWVEADFIIAKLAAGERVNTIFRANLKDEPVKIGKNKVRVFAGCPLAFLLVVRTYFLSLIRVMQSQWKHFECAVGINAYGEDWSELAEFIISKSGGTRMFAGDYSNYDKGFTPLVTHSAFNLLIGLARTSGNYDEEDLCVMNGIATEVSVPYYEWDGVLLKALGSNPSGHPLTVIINNVVNSLYMRYVYYVLHEGETVPRFDERVALICYGDDNVGDVSKEEDKFDHTAVERELAKVGIKYTMADKQAESVPFLPLSEISFLKRGFVKDDSLGEWLAPLEEKSIAKSLHNYMSRRGTDTSPEQISADSLHSALREYFRYGKDTYETRKAQFELVRDECGLQVHCGSFYTYDEMRSQYIDALSNNGKNAASLSSLDVCYQYDDHPDQAGC